MPDWARPIVAFLQPRIGPRGLEFARARVEMKAIETILHLRRAHPARVKIMVPPHVWRVAARYGGWSPLRARPATTDRETCRATPGSPSTP